MVVAAYGDGLYKLLLLGHIISILVAFAPAVIHPVVSAQSKGDGDADLSRVVGHMAANTKRIHVPAMVAIGAFGLLLVLQSGAAWDFGQLWVSLAFLVWLAITAIVIGVIYPGERRIASGDLAAEPRMVVGGQIATVLLVVMLYLMIWKPGA